MAPRTRRRVREIRYCEECHRLLGHEEKKMDYCIGCSVEHHLKTFTLRLHPEYSDHAEEHATRDIGHRVERIQKEARIAMAWSEVVPDELTDDEWTGFLLELFGTLV